MTKYARVVDNVAVEIFVPQDGFTLEESFHPDVAKLFKEVPDGTLANSAWDGKKWVAPIVINEET